MPISIATPQIANAVMPQSRRAMSSGVPSNAEKAILSKFASLEHGASVGRACHPLPRHRPTQRKGAGDVDRKREPAEEEDAHPCPPRRLECLERPGRDRRLILELTQNPDLACHRREGPASAGRTPPRD